MLQLFPGISRIFLAAVLALFTWHFSLAQGVLVVEKNSMDKNYKYHVGNEIRFVAGAGEVLLTGEITLLNDSILELDHLTSVKLKDIHVIYHGRWAPGLFMEIFAKGGIGILVFPAINNLFNHSYPVFDPLFLWIGAGAFGMAWLSSRFIYQPMRIPGHWKLKVLDFDQFRKT